MSGNTSKTVISGQHLHVNTTDNLGKDDMSPENNQKFPCDKVVYDMRKTFTSTSLYFISVTALT